MEAVREAGELGRAADEDLPAAGLDMEIERALRSGVQGLAAMDFGGAALGLSGQTVLGRMAEQLAEVGPEGTREEVLGELARLEGRAGIGFVSYDAKHAFEPACERRWQPRETLMRFAELKDVRTGERENSGAGLAETSASSGADTRKWRLRVEECGEFSPGDYASQVRAIQEEIRAGEYYELNFTQRFRVRSRALPAMVALGLRRRARAPYWAYLDFGDLVVISASPERFIRRSGTAIETKPIKGSARRGEDSASDALQVDRLRADEKNAAEHTMVVDLARNDLGRICRYGSVRTEARAAVESFPTVHHLVSTVVGVLRPGLGIGDVLGATFPAASITGAPKVRVMRAIDEHERSARGIYTGAIGAVGVGGNLDLNVAIRTLVARPLPGGEYDYEFGAGGAVVSDSDPEGEYEECLLKARPLLEAVLAAEEG